MRKKQSDYQRIKGDLKLLEDLYLISITGFCTCNILLGFISLPDGTDVKSALMIIPIFVVCHPILDWFITQLALFLYNAVKSL